MPGELEQDMAQPIPDEGMITDEACEDIGIMIWGIPPMLFGEHLQPPDRMVIAWDKALCRYCNKKGIDPDDYMFDELPLLFATAQIGLFMKKAHKAHKSGKQNDKPVKSDVDFDTGKGVTDSVHEIEPQQIEKVTATLSSGSGGDNLPEEEEKEVIDDESKRDNEEDARSDIEFDTRRDAIESGGSVD